MTAWGVNITFMDNQVASFQCNQKFISEFPNAIYVNSVEFSNREPTSFDKMFCWKGWFYSETEGDCSQLESGPVYVRYYGPKNYSIYPGDSLDSYVQQLTVYDIWGNDITNRENIQVKLDSKFAFTNEPHTCTIIKHTNKLFQ